MKTIYNTRRTLGSKFYKYIILFTAYWDGTPLCVAFPQNCGNLQGKLNIVFDQRGNLFINCPFEKT